MLPSDLEEFHRLRRQRNLLGVAAVVMIAGSMAAVLPGFIKWQNQLKAANNELIDLQQQIVSVQQQIRDAQAQIIDAQTRLSNLGRKK